MRKLQLEKKNKKVGCKRNSMEITLVNIYIYIYIEILIIDFQLELGNVACFVKTLIVTLPKEINKNK